MIITNESDKDRVISHIKALNIDKHWSVDVKLYKKNRSAAQNKLLWLWMNYLAGKLGYDNSDDIYYEMCDMFLPSIVYRGLDGKNKERKGGSSKLKTKEFTQFLEKIDRWSVSFLGEVLPIPEDLYYEAMGIKRTHL